LLDCNIRWAHAGVVWNLERPGNMERRQIYREIWSVAKFSEWTQCSVNYKLMLVPLQHKSIPKRKLRFYRTHLYNLFVYSESHE
jgi:hypothetical protein